MINKKEKVAVAMSGGVDSSVAAWLLQKKGFEVIGMHMRLGLDSSEAENSARKVCQKLKIKFYPINLAADFKKNVKDYFVNSYKSGLTPNPCVNCNRLIKFGELLKRADSIGADYLATGHYIKNQKSISSSLNKNKDIFRVYRSKDEKKDQSYFLYNLNQDILKKIIFPLGDYKKEDVKKIALKNNLPVLAGESQDICFLSGDHNDYLKNNIKLSKGKIICAGKIIGEHAGLPLYTIGQRRGIDIGGDGPYYALKMDYKKNILYVGRDHNDPLLYTGKLIVGDVNWISGIEPKILFGCEASIRYGHKAEGCKIKKLKTDDGYEVEFKKPQRAITPGQSIVFYKDNELLGGGIIK